MGQCGGPPGLPARLPGVRAVFLHFNLGLDFHDPLQYSRTHTLTVAVGNPGNAFAINTLLDMRRGAFIFGIPPKRERSLCALPVST